MVHADQVRRGVLAAHSRPAHCAICTGRHAAPGISASIPPERLGELMGADGLSGGDKLQAHLDRILERVKSAQAVRVGFLEGATYPDGTPLAKIAAVQEFGGTIEMPAREQDLHFKMNAA